MGEVTIVAIPEQDDRTWNVSSDDIPHMTILFLGEVNDPDALRQMIQYVEHYASMLHRFGMSVDRRGVLGDDEADVLFFENGQHEKWLRDMRGNLLQNNEIKKAYDSVEQFPEWTPHLTLGYPEAPAKDDERDYGIGWVSFDRIAIWVDQFEGPTFVLPRHEDVAMAATAKVKDFLSHYGVKGMRWGVRRKSGGKTGPGKTKFTKPANKLSNEELNRRIKRLETEKKYEQLKKSDNSKGRDFAEEVLTTSGKRIAKSVVTGVGIAVVKAAISARFGEDIGRNIS